MNKSVIYKFFIVAATSVLTSCVDSLFEDSSQYGNDLDGVGFSLYVKEQPDMKINIGTSTRSGSTEQSGAAEKVPAPSNVRALEGDNPYALKMQYMTLPYVGIHNGAVRASATQTQTSGQSTGETTRAAWDDHVSSAETFHDSLTVWGYTRDAATKIFDKTLVQRITNWRTSRHWPFGETGPMRFYAVAPSLESINMSVTDADFSTPPILTYTLPEEAQDMCDLLYGESGDIDIPSFGTEDSHEGKDDKNVNLQFQHILTAIRFAQGTIPSDVTVKKISIKNVNTKATFIPSATDNMTDTKGTWSDFGSPGNYTMYASFAGTGSANTYINDSVFYMLPQMVPSGVELEVEIESLPKYSYSSSGTEAYTGSTKKEHTLHCSLAGDIWRKGYTATYQLTIGEVADGYYFVAGALAENEHSDVVATHNFTLHSFRMYVDKETDPTQDITTHGVNWKVVGYYSDAACTEPYDGSSATSSPSWLTNGITGISSGVTGEYVGGSNGTASYNLKGQEPTKSGNHATNLLSNSNAGVAGDTNNNPWDLSVKTPNGEPKPEETANCYIINRTGSYKFPMVYGNKTVATDNVAEASYFVDHTGTVISRRNIKDQITAKNTDPYHYTAYVEGHVDDEEYALERYSKAYTWEAADNVSLRAVVVWQDVENLITNVSVSGINNSITFTVGRSTPGNAVIALQAKSLTKYEKRTYESSTFSDWQTDTSKGTDGYSTGEPWETLWTWHIWMTDEVWPNWSSTSSGATNVNTQYLNNNPVGSGNYIGNHKVAFEKYNHTTDSILPVNLGWVPQEMEFKYYSKREVYVKLQQVEPATDAAWTVVHILQHAKQPLVRGQGTFYQWGRPTALPGYNFTDDPGKTKRTIYFPNEDIFKESDFTVENITNPCEAIAQPTKLFRVESQITTWSSARDEGNSVPYWGETKTVYDPCPPGFKVPHYNVFTGLSLTGATSTTGANLNMWEDAGANFYGGYFYVVPHTDTDRESLSRYAQTVYFPATGQYQATKGVGSSLWLTVSPNNNFIEASPGTFWSNQLPSGDNLHGSALNLYPDITRSNTSKPPVELPRAVNLSTACSIRPVVVKSEE